MHGPAGDALHYSDGSHRWVPADPTAPVEAWRNMVETHIEQAARSGGCAAASRRAAPQSARRSGWGPATAA